MTEALTIITPIIGLISALGVGILAYLTATTNANALVASRAAEAAAAAAKLAAEAVKDTAQHTAQAATRAAEQVQRTVADTAAKATDAAELVQKTLADANEDTTRRMEGLATLAQATHTLVNSNYGMSLLSTLNALKAVEALTVLQGDKKAARAAVAEAQRLYDDHVSKQAVVDVNSPVNSPVNTGIETPTPVPANHKKRSTRK